MCCSQILFFDAKTVIENRNWKEVGTLYLQKLFKSKFKFLLNDPVTDE